MKGQPDTSKRSAWKAGMVGAAIASALTILPVIVLSFVLLSEMDAHSGYGGAALIPAFNYLVLIALIATLVGGIAGSVLLRTRRSILYGIWIIPCTVISVALIVALISYSLFGITEHVKARQARIDGEDRLHQVIANNSGNDVTHIKWMLDGFDGDGLAYDTFHSTTPTPEIITVAIENIRKTPKWHSGLTLSVEWRRPTRGTTFTEADVYSGKAGTQFKANVPVTPYSGIKDKTMLTIFMPGNRVYARIVDSETLENTLRQPIDIASASQGFRVPNQ